MYGEQCQYDCPVNCRTGCDRDYGHCLECADGFWGTTCANVCQNENCSTCIIVTGDCLGCRLGQWGFHCDKTCPGTECKNCDRVYGDCIECQEGRWGNRCQNECDEKCNCCSTRDGTCTSCVLVSNSGNLLFTLYSYRVFQNEKLTLNHISVCIDFFFTNKLNTAIYFTSILEPANPMSMTFMMVTGIAVGVSLLILCIHISLICMKKERYALQRYCIIRMRIYVHTKMWYSLSKRKKVLHCFTLLNSSTC